MTGLAAALGAALLLAASPQDDPKPELRWDVEEGETFDFKWVFQDNRDMKSATGAGNESGGTHIKFLDKRQVEGTLKVIEAGDNGQKLELELAKVSWEYRTNDYQIMLAHSSRKRRNPTTVRSRVLVRDKPGAGVSRAKTAQRVADTRSEQMKKAMESEYVLQTSGPAGTPVMLRDGSPRSEPLFEGLFLHTKLPTGSVTKDQKWRDPLTGVKLPTGLVQLQTIDFKVTSANRKGVTVAGGVSIPIVKPPGQRGETTTGNLTFARQFEFSNENFLAEAKETMKFTKKMRGSGQFAKFYHSDQEDTRNQQLTIKRSR